MGCGNKEVLNVANMANWAMTTKVVRTLATKATGVVRNCRHFKEERRTMISQETYRVDSSQEQGEMMKDKKGQLYDNLEMKKGGT